MNFSLSKLVAGNEKFLIMVLGAVAVFVQATPQIPDQNIKDLLTALIVAAQGWLGTNTGAPEVVTVPVADVKEEALVKEEPSTERLSVARMAASMTADEPRQDIEAVKPRFVEESPA